MMPIKKNWFSIKLKKDSTIIYNGLLLYANKYLNWLFIYGKDLGIEF